MAGKGDKRRPYDMRKWDEGYERMFGRGLIMDKEDRKKPAEGIENIIGSWEFFTYYSNDYEEDSELAIIEDYCPGLAKLLSEAITDRLKIEREYLEHIFHLYKQLSEHDIEELINAITISSVVKVKEKKVGKEKI